MSPELINSDMTHTKYIRTCSIWRALDVIGDKPTLLLLESYWLGTRRFSGFQKQTGLLKTVISNRLGKLIEAGCFEKTLYSTKPERYEYRGTEKVFDLYPTALSMLYWEQKWGRTSGKIQLSLIHKSCGHETLPYPACDTCRTEIDPRDVAWAEGPGVGLMPALYGRRRRKARSGDEPTTPLFDEIADIIGDRWSTLIIRSIFTNRNSYQDICDDTAIATNILAERLERLCAMAVLEKNGSVYKLTPKGRDIYPILIAMMEWGDTWYASPEGPPLVLTHKSCKKLLKHQMICTACGENVVAGDMEFQFFAQKDEALQRVGGKT